MFEDINQEDVRRDLKEVVSKKPQSVRSLCKVIGITDITFNRWMNDKKDMHYVSLLKVKNFIDNAKAAQ